MSTEAAGYLGQGIRFPLGVDHQGRIAMTSGTERIDQAIGLILRTALSERVMRHEFGCGIWDHVFDPINIATLQAIEAATIEAIERWEPRVDLDSVFVEQDPNTATRVLIHISFTIPATNDRRNLVYPFYVIPGEDPR